MSRTTGGAKVQGAVRAKRPAPVGGPRPSGGASKRTVKVLSVALAVAVVIIAVLLAQMAGGGQDPFERRVDGLRAEEAPRDRDEFA